MKMLHMSIILIAVSSLLPITFASGITPMPGPQFHAILDKNNYQNSEKPFLSIFAKPNATINLLVLDSHGLQKLDKNITLKNGTATYSFDISSYSPGICHVIVGDGTDEIKLDFSVGLMPTGGPRIDLLVSKPVYAPNEIIQITGFYRPSAIIHVDLINPNDVLQNSTLLQSDYLGNFQKKFVVPSNAINGTWKINATSGSVHGTTYITIISKNYQENQIDPNNSGPPIPSYSSMTPLQQFKSGVVTQNIACKEGFVLAIKKQGHQPACVNPDTVPKLVLRGWSENPLDNLLLKYGNQTHANLVFYDILNEPKIRDWSMKGWRYSDYSYASNGETGQSSATVHLYLPSNIGKHECENGSYGFVVINLKPVEIEHNYTETGCETVTITVTSVDPESNGK